jgi:hypothetical protein
LANSTPLEFDFPLTSASKERTATRDVAVWGGAFLGDGVESKGTFGEYLAHGPLLGLCGTLGRAGLGITEKKTMQNDVKSLI